MHPIKFLFDDIHRELGIPRERGAKPRTGKQRHSRRFPELGALLLWR